MTPMLRMYNKDFDDDMKLEDIKVYNFQGSRFLCPAEFLDKYLFNSAIHLTAGQYPFVVPQVAHLAKRGHMPVFISKTARSNIPPKVNKIVSDFGIDIPYELHFVKNKSCVDVDVMIDDNLEVLDEFMNLAHGSHSQLDKWGKKIFFFLLMDQPWNRGERENVMETIREPIRDEYGTIRRFPYNADIIRVKDWADIRAAIHYIEGLYGEEES